MASIGGAVAQLVRINIFLSIFLLSLCLFFVSCLAFALLTNSRLPTSNWPRTLYRYTFPFSTPAPVVACARACVVGVRPLATRSLDSQLAAAVSAGQARILFSLATTLVAVS